MTNGYGCAGDDGFGIAEAEMASQYRALVRFLRENKDCFCVNERAVFGSGGSAGAILHQVLTNLYGVGSTGGCPRPSTATPPHPATGTSTRSGT